MRLQNDVTMMWLMRSVVACCEAIFLTRKLTFAKVDYFPIKYKVNSIRNALLRLMQLTSFRFSLGCRV